MGNTNTYIRKKTTEKGANKLKHVETSATTITFSAITVNGDITVKDTVYSDIFSGDTQQAVYYGDGSNLKGISDFYVTGGTFDRNDIGTLTLSRNDGNSLDITGFTKQRTDSINPEMITSDSTSLILLTNTTTFFLSFDEAGGQGGISEAGFSFAPEREPINYITPAIRLWWTTPTDGASGDVDFTINVTTGSTGTSTNYNNIDYTKSLPISGTTNNAYDIKVTDFFSIDRNVMSADKLHFQMVRDSGQDTLDEDFWVQLVEIKY